MAAPIRYSGSSRTALGTGAAIQVQLNPRDVARVRARFAQNMGAPLERRLQIATLKAADLLRGPIASASPVGPARDPHRGGLRRSVRARKAGDLGALVGPRSPLAHLIIRGHRIVTPGGRDTGRVTAPNPYVARAAGPLIPRIVALVKEEAFI